MIPKTATPIPRADAPGRSTWARVWRDDNSNGIQDSGEPGVPGVTVQLKDCNNNVLRTTTTDGNGNYSFTGLAAGCYRVGVVPSGFTISPVNQGTDDTRDSDVDPATAMTGNINLAQGENNPTVDAGLIPPLGSIGNRVWNDVNQNGIQDTGEVGIPNVPVQLKDCNGNIIRTRNTDSNGNYGFNNLAAGCYIIGVVVPSGFQISPKGQGGDGARDSDIDPTTAMSDPVNLAAGQNIFTIDAGLFQPPVNGSLGDRVWRDDNSNGIQDPNEPGVSGVTVQLKDCNNNVLRTATTDGNGNYSFTGLAAGCYRVGIVPSGFTISPVNQGTDDTRDSDVDPATAMTGNINLAQGENNPTVDAGLIPPQPNLGSLGDRLWRDDNRNGVQDSGEPGVPGVTVQLKDCNNNVLRTTTTDGNGNYSFTGLAAGCYVVRFANINSNLFAFTTPDQGGDDTRDSDVTQLDSVTPGIINGQTEPITLAQGQNNPTIDAGLITPQPNLGSLGDRVWRDDNSNGIQDSGESRLAR
ncbi:MAG: hypothetical protein DYG89_46955 [Caldilinea sp. CFX5]|nr:hypothetical protein [Caldilinea sp. CFX5]